MLGGRPRTSIDMLLVRVDTDAGITGWGEAFGHRIFPATRAAIDTLLGPLCVGRDPSQIVALTDELQRVLHGVGPERAHDLRALGHRHRALGHRRQGRRPAPLPPAGRQPPRRPAGLRQPPALRHRRSGGAITPTRRWHAAIGTSSSTRSRCPRSRPRATPPGRACRSWSTRTVPWTVAEAVEMARRLAPLDLALAGGAGVAARERGRARRGAGPRRPRPPPPARTTAPSGSSGARSRPGPSPTRSRA